MADLLRPPLVDPFSAVRASLLRVSDSIAYVAAARHVYAVLVDPEDPDCRLFIKAKNNVAAAAIRGLRYSIKAKIVGHDARLKKDIDAPYIDWRGHVDMTANEALQAADGRSDARREVREFLLDRLEAGPVKADDIFEEAEQNGINKTTLKRVKKELNIRSRKESGRMDGAWTWELPAKPSKGA